MILTVTSQKGGVGKSTTAVSVAARLAAEGHNVLLVDFDPQSHCALSLGMDVEPGIFNWLVGEQDFENCRRTTRFSGLDLLPGDSKTKVVDLVYRSHPQPHDGIVGKLRWLAAEHYSDLVIDTPAAGLLQEAAIAAADVIVVPCRLEHLGVDGVAATLGLVDRLNSGTRTVVLPTQYDARLSEHKYNLGVLQTLEDMEPAAPIPARVAVAEAVAAGQTVWEYNSRGIADVRTGYQWLVERITEEHDAS